MNCFIFWQLFDFPNLRIVPVKQHLLRGLCPVGRTALSANNKLGPLVQCLSTEDLDNIAANAWRLTVEPGQEVIQQGSIKAPAYLGPFARLSGRGGTTQDSRKSQGQLTAFFRDMCVSSVCGICSNSWDASLGSWPCQADNFYIVFNGHLEVIKDGEKVGAGPPVGKSDLGPVPEGVTLRLVARTSPLSFPHWQRKLISKVAPQTHVMLVGGRIAK